MDILTLLQPAGATTTGAIGSTQSAGTANGSGGFEQLLFNLLTPGLAASQGASQPATGVLGSATVANTLVNSAPVAKAAAGAVGLLAGTTGAQPASTLVEATGTALTGAAVLGVSKVLPTAGSGEQVQPKTGSQATALPTSSNSAPITSVLSTIKSSTVQGLTAAVAGKTAIPAIPTPGNISAQANKAIATLTSAAKGPPTTGSPSQQGAAALVAGSAVTAALNEKTVTPGEPANKSASLTGSSSEVATAKATITAAVIDAPGAGKKSEKSAAKTDNSGAVSLKSSASTRQTLQAQNGATVAQAAQAATKANAGKPQSPSGKVQAIESFGAALTSAVSTGGESVTLASVSSVTTSAGAESASHAAAARAAAPSAPVPQQVAVQFSQALAAGADRISIQLQPESLGRVQVEIELTKDGRLSAVFIAERPETLDMLQRDSRALERALNDAGVRTDADGLSFSFRGEGRQAQQFNDSQGGPGGGEFGGIEGEEFLTPRAPILNANALLDIQV